MSSQLNKNLEGLQQNLINVAKSLVNDFGDNIKPARYKVCKQCESFENQKCKECGCYMALKTLLPHAKCPRGNW